MFFKTLHDFYYTPQESSNLKLLIQRWTQASDSSSEATFPLLN
jgi:hypothetical protein